MGVFAEILERANQIYAARVEQRRANAMNVRFCMNCDEPAKLLYCDACSLLMTQAIAPWNKRDCI